MLHTPLWTLLCALPRGRAALAPHERRILTARLRAGALQPVNALVFVYDGLIYAVRAFGFLRNALLLGVCCTFAPALALAKTLSPSSLLAIWAAKAALNCWRCGSALLLIHVRHWPHWGGGRAQASAQADPAPRVPAPHTRTRPPPSPRCSSTAPPRRRVARTPPARGRSSRRSSRSSRRRSGDHMETSSAKPLASPSRKAARRAAKAVARAESRAEVCCIVCGEYRAEVCCIVCVVTYKSMRETLRVPLGPRR